MNQEDNFSIWPPYQAFYIQSMLFNTGSALQAYTNAVDCIEAIYKNEVEPNQVRDSLLDDLHGVINHSGSIARYFFPSRDSPKKASVSQQDMHKRRAEYLRKIFQIDNTSPLADKSLRNAIEHFDERLDLYLENGIVGHIFPSLILDAPEDTEVPHHIFRAFYLQEGIFQILGERYHVQPIVDEVIKIHNLLLEFDKKGGKLNTK